MDGVRRSASPWIAAGLALAFLVGCSASKGGGGVAAPGTAARTTGTEATSPPTTASATLPTPAPGPARCRSADLAARLRRLDSAAGQRYAAVVLTNRSSRACGLYGYGGIGLLDAAHRPVPTRQVRDPLVRARPVPLRPGASAYSRLHWGVVAAGTDRQTGQCEPTPAHLLVTPPDETRPITVAWSYGAVCQRGRIEQTAYRPGGGPTA